MTPPTQLKNCLRPLSIFSKGLLILLLVVSSLGLPLRGQQGGVAPSGPQVRTDWTTFGSATHLHFSSLYGLDGKIPAPRRQSWHSASPHLSQPGI